MNLDEPVPYELSLSSLVSRSGEKKEKMKKSSKILNLCGNVIMTRSRSTPRTAVYRTVYALLLINE